MIGYLEDPDATAEAIDADGWLHTGDVGHLDDRGYLTITDRLKDMYICGGFNVYPAEVEQALMRHARRGRGGGGRGARRPSRRGRQGFRGGQAQPSVPTAAELIEFCRSRLANYKVPRQIEFRTDLPRNPAGKPLKRLLRQES